MKKYTKKKHKNHFRKDLFIFTFLLFIFGVLPLVLISSCGKLSPFVSQATTNLKSSTLSGLSVQSVTALATFEGGNYYFTPSKITGKIASIVLATGQNEGVVIYGDGRPDIKKANTALYDFNMSQVNTFSGLISKPPWYVGGSCEVIPIMYGYFDVTFTQGGQTREVRMVYGDTDPYVRGDKLLKINDKWQWYDLTAGTFTSESRSPNPAVNTTVRDFKDIPERAEMHYFYLVAKVLKPFDLPLSLLENNNLTFTIDYDLTNAVAFTGVTSVDQFNALSSAEVIQKFDMKQNVSDWWHSPGITCIVTVEATPK